MNCIRAAATVGAGGAAGLVASSSSLPAVPWAFGAVCSTPSAAASSRSRSSSRCHPRRRGTGGSSTARRRRLLQRQSKQSARLLCLESGECRTHKHGCVAAVRGTLLIPPGCSDHCQAEKLLGTLHSATNLPACLLSLHYCCSASHLALTHFILTPLCAPCDCPYVPATSWSKVCARTAAASPYGREPGWGLAGAIVKSGDDCRQELLALQLIRELQDIWTGVCGVCGGGEGSWRQRWGAGWQKCVFFWGGAAGCW